MVSTLLLWIVDMMATHYTKRLEDVVYVRSYKINDQKMMVNSRAHEYPDIFIERVCSAYKKLDAVDAKTGFGFFKTKIITHANQILLISSHC